MALFQHRPQADSPLAYTTIGFKRDLLIVGLGNPGEEYDGTRHNVGFMCLDEFVEKTDEMGGWVAKKDLKCHLSSGQIGDARVLAIKPITFMNLSGEAVAATANFYKISPDHIVVLHDELDIDFGQIRVRQGGSSAGHNGVKSVSQHLGEDYGRLRIGIGPKPARIKSEAFVLQRFSAEEQSQLPNLTREAIAILTEYIYGGQLPHETRDFLV